MANPRKWTFEAIQQEASRYSTRSAFSKDSQSAYNTAHKMGWLDAVCSHMQPKLKWTFDTVKEEALNYQTRTAFQKGSSSAYQSALKNGWLEQVCSHMQPKVKWTLESIHKEALNYTTRSAFQKGSTNAYQTAYKNGWLDKVCSHMDRTKKGAPTKWTLETVQQEAVLYSARYEFAKGSNSAYRSACRYGWLDAVCTHMDAPKTGAPTKWTFELVQQQASLYATRTAFQMGSPSAYQTARKNGWLDHVCTHMDAPRRGAPTKWTPELVHREALNYATRTAFQKGSTNAYQTARKNGWLDQVCSHMQRKVKWTFEAVQKEASLYTTRTKFAKGSNSAYQTALKNDWLDGVCSHMKKSVCTQ